MKQKPKAAAKAPAKKAAPKMAAKARAVKPAKVPAKLLLKKPEPKKPELKKIEVKKLPPVKPGAVPAAPPVVVKKLAPGPKPESKNSKASLDGEDSKTDEEKAESAIIDTVADAIKKMIKKGKDRGYVTVDEINAALPQDKINSDLIEDTMAMLSEMGISVSESEEDEEKKEKEAKAEEKKS